MANPTAIGTTYLWHGPSAAYFLSGGWRAGLPPQRVKDRLPTTNSYPPTPEVDEQDRMGG